MYKQIIIVRKDLAMSCGKMAAQVSHASMAFLTNMIRNNTKADIHFDELIGFSYHSNGKPRHYGHPDLDKIAEVARNNGEMLFSYKPEIPGLPLMCSKLIKCDVTTKRSYHTEFDIDKDLYEQWINGSFTKCVLEAKNKNHLLKAKKMAEELGMIEDEDLFLIKDNCYTELEPEEIDEDGVGRTLTCIGFKPMDSEIIDQIGKKYQLYKS